MEKNKEIQMNENKTLGEEHLEAVSGGATQNRYDPKVCPALSRTRYECVGLFQSCWCDHYSRTFVSETHDGIPEHPTIKIFLHECAMGAFIYRGKSTGEEY